MKTCVVKLSDEYVYSLIIDRKLVFHKPLENVSELPEILYKQGIDRLVFFCQGIPVPMKTDDSYKISSLYINDKDIPLVIKDTDYIFFSECANILGISDVRIVSYIDYVENKFESYGDLVLVDKYLDAYAVMYMKNKKIRDFERVSAINLTKKISSFKTMYNCSVMAVSSMKQYIGLQSYFINYSKIPEDQLFHLDYIPYALEGKYKNLLEKDTASIDSLKINEDDLKLFENDSEYIDTEDDEEDIGDLVKQLSNPRQRKKGKTFKQIIAESHLGVDQEKLKRQDKFIDSIVTVCLVLSILLLVVGGILTVVYKHKMESVDKHLSIQESRLMNSSIQDNYLSKGKESIPINQARALLAGASDLQIIDCQYNLGDLNITVADIDETSVSNSKNVIQNIYPIKNSTNLNTVMIDNQEYISTQYSVNPWAV